MGREVRVKILPPTPKQMAEFKLAMARVHRNPFYLPRTRRQLVRCAMRDLRAAIWR